MDLEKELNKILSAEKVKTKLIDRYAFAPDAGFYYLLPKAVVQPSTEEEIKALFSFSKTNQIPLVFRAGGTSLSGQSITDGILVDISRYWRSTSVLDAAGESVKVQPGIIAANVNLQLKKFGKKIGPDPASINAAMMGGILSNNSSGMCCGVVHNSYHTLQSAKFILPNGKTYNTAIKLDYSRFEEESADIYQTIIELKNRLIAHPDLVNKIRLKYQLKNTVGYSLNAFLDYEHPLDIFAHLLIGAEGTLAFISEAVLNTIPDEPFKTTALLYFENPKEACEAIPSLKTSGAATLELMDRSALRSIENHADAPDIIKHLPNEATAILCEYHAATKEQLNQHFEQASNYLNQIKTLHPIGFTTDAYVQEKYWKLRKGMYPSVAAARKKGTTVLLEDIAFPVEVLGNAVADVQQLLVKFGYHDAIIFGHAKEGNLHFVFAQSFNDAEEVKKYEDFSNELGVLVIDKYQGSLKAEHGTGRQIAPFVKDEWGEEAYLIMKELKNVVDPQNLLNPGVILNEDKDCHLKNLKSLPVVEQEVDKCIECGYCEHKCPSKDYTLTPRQRIVIRRAIKRLEIDKNEQDKKELIRQYQFSGLDTCAVDGMCATVCPVDINTGELVKRLRRENHSTNANKFALTIAKNFKLTENMVIFALQSGNMVNAIFGKNALFALTSFVKKFIPAFPLWTKQLKGPVKIPLANPLNPQVVYMPTCITRMMGDNVDQKSPVPMSLLRVSEKASIQISIPTDIKGVCCGQAFSSKGFTSAYAYTVNNTVEKIWNWTQQGKLPLLLDITSCTQSILQSKPYLTAENQQKFEQITFLDTVDFIADRLLPEVKITSIKDKIVLHPVCSSYKMNQLGKLKTIGNACAHECEIPNSTGCCGMAGDRGFYYPKLTQAATKIESNEVKQKRYDGYYSSGKTCEMALSEAVGENYHSLLSLLDDVTD